VKKMMGNFARLPVEHEQAGLIASFSG
jgi:hypothetical protein